MLRPPVIEQVVPPVVALGADATVAVTGAQFGSAMRPA